MMKFTTAAVVAFTLTLSSTATAKDIVVVLSPYQEQAEANRQAKTVLQELTQLEPGDKGILIDGYHLKTIGIFAIPEKKAYASPKARLRVNGSVVGALMSFAKQATPYSEDSAPSVSGAVRLPQVLRHIAENYGSDQKLDVIILGSPFYDDPNEPKFSMADGVFPSDAHLLSSRANTPFGTTDQPELLSNVQVHLCYGDEAIMRSDRHHFFVHRFWTLFTEQQAGKLVSFTADCAAMFHRVKNKAKAPKHNYILDSAVPFAMIRLEHEGSKNTIYKRHVTTSPLPKEQIRHAQQIELGLSWDSCPTCDLDLYAQSSPGAAVISFRNNNTPEGIHRKDYRTSPRSIRAYETIVFNKPLDLRTLKIAVNFYKGDASNNVSGELRLSVDGRTYATQFTLRAKSGNKGRGMSEAFKTGQAPNAHIVIIDPLRMVGTK